MKVLDVKQLYAGYKRPYGIINTFKSFWDIIKGLAKQDDSRAVVKGLSFSVPKGRAVGFLGVNGAGKTTTMKAVSGLIHLQKGEVEIFERPLKSFDRYIRKNMGSLIGSPDLYPYLTGRQNLQIISGLYCDKEPADQRAGRIDSMLEKTGLLDSGDKLFSSYSTGMKQRLAIAAALIHSPGLLFLDEPTSGLDPKAQADVKKIIKDLSQKEDVTVFISSHLLYEIEQLCDYVVIIDKGKLTVMGEVSALLSRDTDFIEIECAGPEKVQACLEADKSVKNIKSVKNTNSFKIEAKKGKGPQILKNLIVNECIIYSFTPQKVSLEEYFLEKLSTRE